MRQHGFSLVETVMVLGFAGIVALGGTYLVVSQQKLAIDSGAKTDLTNAHAISLQQSRSFPVITQYLLLTGGARNPALDRCLVGRAKAGENCQSYAKTTNIPSSITGIANITSEIQAQLTCRTVSKCDSVVTTVVTRSTVPTTGGLSEKKSRSEFPALAFAPFESIDFACSNGSVLTSIDLSTREAVCSPMMTAAERACVGFGPMTRFGSSIGCQPLENRTCNSGTGLGTFGMFNADSSCAPATVSGAVPSSPTATPTPTPTATPTSTPVACTAPFIGGGSGEAMTGNPSCHCPNVGERYFPIDNTCEVPACTMMGACDDAPFIDPINGTCNVGPLPIGNCPFPSYYYDAVISNQRPAMGHTLWNCYRCAAGSTTTTCIKEPLCGSSAPTPTPIPSASPPPVSSPAPSCGPGEHYSCDQRTGNDDCDCCPYNQYWRGAGFGGSCSGGTSCTGAPVNTQCLPPPANVCTGNVCRYRNPVYNDSGGSNPGPCSAIDGVQPCSILDYPMIMECQMAKYEFTCKP